MAWATVEDLAAWLPPDVLLPEDAERQLARAEAVVRRVLIAAVYDVDSSGLPTDTGVAAALRDAVCAVVEYRLATGDDGTGDGGWTSVSAGSVSMSRAGPDPVAVGGLPQAAMDAISVLPADRFRWGVCTW